MMLLDDTIRKLRELDPRDLVILSELVSALHERKRPPARKRTMAGACRAQKLLAGWKGSLSDMIAEERGHSVPKEQGTHAKENPEKPPHIRTFNLGVKAKALTRKSMYAEH